LTHNHVFLYVYTQEQAQLADLTTCVDENEKLLSANRELSLSLPFGRDATRGKDLGFNI
jgi:hypothetical protein